MKLGGIGPLPLKSQSGLKFKRKTTKHRAKVYKRMFGGSSIAESGSRV